MELSTNIGYLYKQRGTTKKRSNKDAAIIVRNAGFKYIDYGLTALSEKENCLEIALQHLKDFEELGLTVDQTHAPFRFESYDEETYKTMMQRAFEGSKLLGAKNIVIHADKYVPDENGFDFDKALNTVYDFYAPYVEYAKKVGLGVAIENLFDDIGHPENRSRFTSYVEEQIAIIEKFNDPIVTACWDFGHAKVSYGDEHIDALKKVGKYLTSTHVHDNYYRGDLHTNVFFGDTDWEATMACLKEIGYNGKFTFEMVFGCLPDALVQEYMTLYYKTGEYMLGI